MEKYMRRSRDGGVPPELEAVRLTAENVDEVAAWVRDAHKIIEHDALDRDKTFVGLNIATHTGVRRASEGSWIVRDRLGDFLVLKPSLFEMLYVRA